MNKKAFSLVELLVVIAVIGILATLAVVSLQGARKGARDAKRIANIKQIQTALELYYNDQGQYPESLNFGQGSIESPNAVYMEKIPSAPSPADGNCGSNNAYLYIPIGINGRAYQISFCLGSKVGQLDPGPHCAKPGGIIPGSCGDDFICGDPLYDSRDGNVYNTVAIGDQCWFQENLAYLPTVHSNAEFATQGSSLSPGYGVYGYDGGDVAIAKSQANYLTYGVLYNWYAVDQASICPTGWHVPTDAEWTELSDFLGGGAVAGEKLKASSTDSIPWNGTNSSGFTALPAGRRGGNGDFHHLGGSAYFWSSSEGLTGFSWSRYLRSGFALVGRIGDYQTVGYSVRCLRTE